ncbi:hypothetical protein ACFE04_020898 [Oxalis oulophora]
MLQVSFLLGVIPVFVAWIYSEFLDYKKYVSLSKVHSDNNLVELDKDARTEDDRVVLLEGGLAKSASVKFITSSIKTNIIRSTSPITSQQQQQRPSVNQPPLLSSMVHAIDECTGDVELVKTALPRLLKEYDFWNSGSMLSVIESDCFSVASNIHSVTIKDVEGCEHRLSRYYMALHTNVDCNALVAAVVSRQVPAVRLLLQSFVESPECLSLI